MLLLDSSAAQKTSLPQVPTLLLSPFSVGAYKEDDPSLDLAVQLLHYFDTARELELKRNGVELASYSSNSRTTPLSTTAVLGAKSAARNSATDTADAADDDGSSSVITIAGYNDPAGSSIGAFYSFLVRKAEVAQLMPYQRRRQAGSVDSRSFIATGSGSSSVAGAKSNDKCSDSSAGGPISPTEPCQPIDESVGVFSVILRMMAEERRHRATLATGASTSVAAHTSANGAVGSAAATGSGSGWGIYLQPWKWEAWGGANASSRSK